MNPAWLEENEVDKWDSEKLRRRNNNLKKYRDRLLDERRRGVGLDLEILARQLDETEQSKVVQAELLLREADDMMEAMASYAGDIVSERQHKLQSQKEYADYLRMQTEECKLSVSDDNFRPSVAKVDPNFVSAEHARSVARLQAKGLLEQMAESAAAADNLLNPSPLPPDPKAESQRFKLLEYRRQQREQLDAAYLASMKSKSSPCEKSSQPTSLPNSKFHALPTDFKGVSREVYRSYISDNARLSDQKRTEYVNYMEEEKLFHENRMKSVQSEIDRLNNEVEKRKQERLSCDMDRLTRSHTDPFAPAPVEFLEKRFGNSLV